MNVVLALVLMVSPELDEARLQMSRLRYKAAVPMLSKVAASTQLPVTERLEANELLARAHLAMGDTTKAEAAYDVMLSLDPMAAEPQGAPKLVAAFRRAKERRFPRGTVLLERRPRTPDVVEVQVINPWRTALTLQLMTATTGAFSPTTMPLDDRRVAVATLTPGSRFYVRATGADGAVLAQVGSELEPFAGPPAPAPATPPSVNGPPALPSAERPAVATTPTASPRAKSGTLLDEVLSPRVLPIAKPALLGRVAGWVLLGAGILLALAGGGTVGWGLLDLDRTRRPAEFGLSAADVVDLRRLGEDKVLFGGIGIGVGAVVAIVGGILLAVTPAE
ncbi:MAG: hypothetical protein Q8S33_06190 [Myxococcales bacterium]|nr:hypothetical protein [Myxococcales bacterium]